MDVIMILVIILLAGLAGYLYYAEKRAWVEIHASTAKHPNEAIRIFSALQRNDIRCRLQNNKLSHGKSAAKWENTAFVYVHRSDLENSRDLVKRLKK